MGNFVCSNCGYRLDSESKKVKKCPYCDDGNMEKEKSAEELVNNIEVE